MALTGAVLLLYLVVHMVGNLKIFFGEEALNTYAHWLRVIGEPALPGEGMLWIVRTVLLVSVVAHIVAATILARRARRPSGPLRPPPPRDDELRLAHHAVGWRDHPAVRDLPRPGPHDQDGEPERRARPGLRQRGGRLLRWYITLAYTVAMIAVGFHVRHGAWSALQTLGRSSGPDQALQGDRAGVRGGPDGGLPRRAVRRAVRIGRCPVTGYADYTVGPPVEDDAAPGGSIDTRWERHRFGVKLVNPANKRKMKVIVVGTGLAGGSATATLGELGYQVSSFCFQESPRRAPRSRAGRHQRREELPQRRRQRLPAVLRHDQGQRLRVERPPARRDQPPDHRPVRGAGCAVRPRGVRRSARRSFGGAQVSRTFYARGQTGQQLLLGAYQALERQIRAAR